MKPLNQYCLCPECIASLQSQLPAIVAVAYCPHVGLGDGGQGHGGRV